MKIQLSLPEVTNTTRTMITLTEIVSGLHNGRKDRQRDANYLLIDDVMMTQCSAWSLPAAAAVIIDVIAARHVTLR